MSFTLNCNTLPHIRTYDRAVEFHKGAKPWRGYDDDFRKLVAGSSKHNWSVRRYGESIAFRYHNTDVIIWHGPHKFECNVWASISTSKFANCFAPRGVYMDMTCAGGPAAICCDDNKESRVYLLGRQTIFERADEGSMWLATSGFRPIDVPVIDQRRLRAALKARGYHDLRNWLLPAMAIHSPKRLLRNAVSEIERMAEGLNVHPWGAKDRTLHVLANRELWPAFLISSALWPTEPRRECWGKEIVYTHERHAKSILAAVRTRIYLADDVVSIEKRDYVESFDQLSRISKSLYL